MAFALIILVFTTFSKNGSNLQKKQNLPQIASVIEINISHYFMTQRIGQKCCIQQKITISFEVIALEGAKRTCQGRMQILKFPCYNYIKHTGRYMKTTLHKRQFIFRFRLCESNIGQYCHFFQEFLKLTFMLWTGVQFSLENFEKFNTFFVSDQSCFYHSVKMNLNL